jgi:hypothetical protein
LPPDQVQAFDQDLGAMLGREFPRQPIPVPHCLHVACGRKS